MWQRQQRMQRWVLRGGIVIIILVIGIIGYGYYASQLGPSLQSVARVNGRVFNMGYFVDLMKYTGVAGNPTVARGMADRLAEIIWDNEILFQGAGELGISASAEEVAEVLKERGQPNSKAARDMAKAELLSGEIFDQHFKPQAPTVAPQVKAQAMLLASQEKVQEAGKRLGSGESFGDIAKDLSEPIGLTEEADDLGWIPRGVFTEVFDSVVFGLKPGEVSEPFLDSSNAKMGGYWIIRVLERDEDGVHLERMLLGSEEEAQRIKESLDRGDDFAVLAREFSLDEETKDNGGDLGKREEGTLLPLLAEAARSLELQTVSQLIYDEDAVTKGAYWIIKLLEGPDEGEVSEDNRSIVARNLYNQWFSEMRQASHFENLLDEEKKDWAVEQIS
jgi:parvulin-like peptidyl-prolyl isomerase